jgi:hypothetical protein
LPSLRLLKTLTREVYAKLSRTISAVLSVEPSSTTTILNFFACEASSARMELQITLS